MNKQNAKLYFAFIAAFLVMHFTGEVFMKLPHSINAVMVFTVVLNVILLLSKLFYRKRIKTTIGDVG